MIVVMHRPVCVEAHTGTNSTGKRWRFVGSGLKPTYKASVYLAWYYEMKGIIPRVNFHGHPFSVNMKQTFYAACGSGRCESGLIVD